jgi:hypothetical protein
MQENSKGVVDASVLPSTIELQARMYMLIATIMHASIDSSGGREYAEREKRRRGATER